jgi:tRNA-splicing ligase RtcB (3'-phosphate/5'-hydroxy nucleic acid ligase)
MLPLMEAAGANCYKIPRSGQMKADVLVYLNRQLYLNIKDDQSLQQLIDAATLKGVISPVIGMPDIHSGFGLPIGGVMAMDADDGLISAGAVGMDINCGVRLLRTNIHHSNLSKVHLLKLIQAIADRVPSGVGQNSKHAPLIKMHFNALLQNGVPLLIELGFGRTEDLLNIEDNGSMPGAEVESVSKKAVNRGLQLSTIGGGNHFIELGFVEKVYDLETAKIFGLEEESLTVMIHTGSRGFGHQICTDYSAEMKQAASKYSLNIPSAGLAAVPINSPEGQRYFGAMNCAINFAFCNRQWITDDVRKAFSSVLGGADQDYDLGLVYDLAHNTARFETFGGHKMLIHRKGAARALPPGHSENPKTYKTTGHPVLIPGSMGSSSFVIRALPAVEKIYNSVNHGAGRVLSRSAARREISVQQLKERMAEVIISGGNYKAYLDEAPQAYKDIEQVIDTLTEIGFSQKVARLRPLAVLKGEGGD